MRVSLLVCLAVIALFDTAHGGEKPTIGEKSADWWSLRPLVRPPLPSPPDVDSIGARLPVDAFIGARLREKGLRPAPPADRRTLIRRLTFDLVGLPPTPQQIDDFLNDPRADAYERLVDRLLASPLYGERWGRHWLDVVHYGDTHGYDKDKPRLNAWPYRDYVIRSFNADKPFGRFIQEQIAGDVLFPGEADGIEALGFIAAGPWDFIGHAELAESKIDGKIARHLDRDDMVANTMMTFASLTVQCAQCHNHKFDPIPQEDYYSLQAVFAALDRADRPYYRERKTAEQAERLNGLKRHAQKQLADADAAISQLGGPELTDIDRRLAAAAKPKRGFPPEHGYHSRIEPAPDRVKWVQIDLGKSRKIERIAYIGCHDDFNNIGAGFGFPVRYKIEVSDDAKFERSAAMVVDHTQRDVANPGVTPQSASVAGLSARYVRITATRLAVRQNDFNFALAEVMVLDADGNNIAAGANVTASDSIEAPVRWRMSNLTDGIYPGSKNQDNSASIAALERERMRLLEARVGREMLAGRDAIRSRLAEIEQQLAKLPPPSVVYAGTVHTGTGTFVGTGASGGTPRPIHVLARGDVRKPVNEVGPGALQAVTGLPARFSLPPHHHEGDRRAALANWLSDVRNPLPWRSIVNRVWRYHFGRGLVESPNDFGRMGRLPTHPELLDWLAADFRDHGQSIKRLHRNIVLSAAYRQQAESVDVSEGPNSANEKLARAIDADNSLYWRMNRRRLEAEAVRDSVLAVAGKLDRRMSGPAFQDFVIEKPEHSPHYQYHKHDPDDPRSHRRSVYRFLVRSQQQPFMTTLDCADPSMQVDRRNETISALQALALLNNDFMLSMSRHFAARVEGQADDTPGRLTAAFHLALGRPPTRRELEDLHPYAERHGLANACRMILNLNEFVFVD